LLKLQARFPKYRTHNAAVEGSSPSVFTSQIIAAARVKGNGAGRTALISNGWSCRNAIFRVSRQQVEVSDASAFFLVPQCYVLREVLTWRLTSEIGERKKRTVMITAIRKPLDTRTAAGCYSPTSSHALPGQFIARVEGIEL
jgi:hypothetical protein